ncbi:TipJ family phage tail tip protein [Pseudomonas rhodesiae]|uniref:TipJ family phage tail tip protein n=1 Tax=Pseudomonas rhodesiae TaxID=76760 RepID=UPI000F4A0CAC|nr:phage tail protein [Pseudomonas rhodesiae]ROM60925.1 host specificity protein [Pseudomonas rhodesiae]ROM67549.1 host specificity protein [Pseudomonas rhodesiae]
MSKTATAPASKRRRRPGAARVLGGKGGEKKPYTPYKAPDTALSVATVKLLYALSEGPIVGPVDGLRSVKLNGTPLLSPDGSENFPGTIWDFRPGTVDQEHIAGFPAIENEASQGLPVELKSDSPWTHAITDQQLSAVRVRLSWPQIWQIKTNGDQIGYRIDYAIDLSVDGGSYQTVLSAILNDKGTTEYERTHRIDLPEGFTSALVRVRRLTPNRNDSNFADLMRIKGLTEVIDKKLRYPNLALGGLQFDAKQFQDTPKFAALMRGRIVQVPTNYDAGARTYTGDWNGTFKLSYTNNPVWIWRDLLLHRRYGLGRRITADMVDHWTLYEIGRYCDVMVPDGKGGMQPRMTTNVYIQDSIEGYALLSDLASVFRGSSCWNGSKVTMVADIPGNEDGYVFTRSNIIGEFEYVAAAYPDRHTRAKVAWDNPENEFKTQPAPVTNEELIGALGHRMLDISRFGCTVEGEAIRHGVWALKSEQYEEWSVSFTTGMEGRNVEPGQIICVADEMFSGRANGGRISAATRRVITLDIDAEVHEEDRLILNLPSGKSEGRIVKSVSGRLVTVMADYSELPEPECSWSVESVDLAVMRFRVQTIEPQGLHQFKIAATQHEPLKYPAIDTGARIDPQPTSIIPPGVMSPPANIGIAARSVVSQGIAVTSMRITWDSVPGAIAYNVEWRKDSGNWIRLPRTGNLGAEVEGIYSGRYVARVSSINAMDVTSIWGSSSEIVLTGKVGLPPAVAFLTTTSLVYGIGIQWGFPPGAEDTQRTELWYSSSPDLTTAEKLSDFSYPQTKHEMQNILAGASFYFWARLVDRTGNVGPFWPIPGAVNGRASSDQTEYDKYFAEKIGKGAFYQSLREEIDLITGDGPGSVNDRLEKAKQELESLISEVVDALEYVPTKTYAKGDMVRVGQQLFQATKAVPVDTVPPNANYWFNLGTIAETNAAMALEISQNKSAIEEVDGKVTATAERLEGVYALVKSDSAGSEQGSAGDDTASAGAWSLMSAIAERDFAQSQRTDIVEAKVQENTASILDVSKTAASATSALAERVTTIGAKVSSNEAAFKQETSALADADKALAQKIETVQASSGENAAAIQLVNKAQATTDGKVSSMVTFKAQTTAGGKTVASGFAFGTDGEQSEFLIFAQRFAVVDEVSGQLIPMFVVQGNQVVLSQAVISAAFIQKIILGMTLRSEAVDSNGNPLIELDMKSGKFSLRGSKDGNSSLLDNNGLKFIYSNGVVGVDLSL